VYFFRQKLHNKINFSMLIQIQANHVQNLFLAFKYDTYIW